MTPNEYQALALRTAAPWRQSQDFALTRAVQAMHAVLGLSSEVGELCDAYKKSIYYGRPLDVTNVSEEIGDVLWYLALLCDDLGTTLEAEMCRNIAKLQARYPEKFSEDAANVRDLDAERKVLEGGE